MSQASSVDIVINAATQQAGAAMMDFGGKFAAALSVERILRWMLATSEAIERTGRLAEGVGMAVEAFSDLQASAKLSDVEVGELSAGLRTFNGQIAEASKSGSQAGAIFRAMGIDVQGKNTAQILNEVADAFQSYENGAKKTALAQQLFGRGSLEMISWLNKGSAGMRESAALAAALGVTLDQNTVEAAGKMSDAWKKMTMAFSASGNELVKTFGPALTKVIDLFTVAIIAARALGQMVWTSMGLLGAATVDLFKGDLKALTSDFATFSETINKELDAGREGVDALFKKTTKTEVGTKEAPGITGGVKPVDTKALQFLDDLIFKKKTSLELSRSTMDIEQENYEQGLISAETYYQRIDSELKNQLRLELEIIQAKRNHLQALIAIEAKLREQPDVPTPKETDLLRDRSGLILETQKLKDDADKKLRDNQKKAVSSTFTGGLHDAAEAMDNFSDHGKAAATIFSRTFGTAIQGLSSGIMGLIRGTMTWGQAMLRIGDSILENIISMILEYTVFHQIRMVFDQLFHAAAKTNIATTSGVANTATVANASTQAGANDTILATAVPAATAESGATFGMNWVVGLAIGIAAIAALMAAFGAFESGGLVTGGEQFVRVNERGPEFIVNSSATQRLGLPALEALNRGIIPTATFGARSSSITSVAAPMQSSGKAGAGVNVSFGQLSDRNALRQFMAGEGSKIVISQFNRRSNKINL